MDYRDKIYEEYGIIYIYNLGRYTLSIKMDEAKGLLEEAANKGIRLVLRPKKIFYNVEKGEFTVYDYFIDHDVCPFLEGKNHCSIYERRPEVCRIYPHKMRDFKELSETISLSQMSYKVPFNHALRTAKSLFGRLTL